LGSPGSPKTAAQAPAALASDPISALRQLTEGAEASIRLREQGLKAEADRAVAEQQAALLKAWPELMSRLGAGHSDKERLEALALMSRAANAAYLTQQTEDGGNCTYSAMATIASIESGRLMEPIPYRRGRSLGIAASVGIDMRRLGFPKDLEKAPQTGDVLFNGRAIDARTGADLAAAAAPNLAEGQLAFLTSVAQSKGGVAFGAHATAVVKLGGRLYNVNNQDGPAQAQTLQEWHESWSKESQGMTTSYRLTPSRVHLPR
jgi:hypothetical protein